MTKAEPARLSRYLAKLEARAPISREAREAFCGMGVQSEEFGAYRDVIRERDKTSRSCFVESGLVSRYKTLRNGARQIVSFHIPGDMVDLQSCLVLIADHGIRTHVPTTVLSVAHSELLDVAAAYPEIGRAFWFDTLVDAAVFREWTLNVGRRTARERTAHLLLEFGYRFRSAGMGDGREFALPISQADLADAVGITPVHLNRSLQWLRAEGMIRTQGKTVVIEDWDAMAQLSDFNSVYLHPEGPRMPNGEARPKARFQANHANLG